LVIHAEFPVKREKTKDAKEAAERLVVGSRRESGVLEYLVTSDVEDENTPLFVERYEDKGSFGAHSKTEHFEELGGALPDMLVGEPLVTKFGVPGSEELEL